jgi:hypothetical protein
MCMMKRNDGYIYIYICVSQKINLKFLKYIFKIFKLIF